MSELRDRLAFLMQIAPLDMRALSNLLDQLPPEAGGEATMVVRQARRSMAMVAKGNKKFKPLLRHSIARLIVLLGDEEVR